MKRNKTKKHSKIPKLTPIIHPIKTIKNKTNKKEIEIGLKIIVTTITIVSIILIIYTLLNQQTLENQFSSQIQSYGLSALLILTFFLDLIPQLISPVVILAISLTTPINPTFAITSAIIGSTLGSTLGFIIGKSHMNKIIKLTVSKKTNQKITHLTNKHGKIIIPLTAISPLPYFPMLLGAMNLSKTNFLIYGIIPRALSFIAYGYIITL